jgi:hypothetical protein
MATLPVVDSESIRLPQSWSGKTTLFFALGLALIGASALVFLVSGTDVKRGFFHSYLANFMYCMSFGIAAMFFVLISFLTRAAWNASVRRWAEIISMTIPWMALLFIPILLLVVSGTGVSLYEWNQSAQGLVEAHEPVVAEKLAYLNGNFFAIRAIVILVGWSLIVSYYYRQSRKEDETGDVNLTIMRQWYSGPLVMFFALSVSCAAFDWIMSIDGDWYSTIFGVYIFAGGMFGFFGLMISSLTLLQRQGKMKDYVNTEHFHDLGKFQFGFTMFWSYIAFSQMMLIWYANIPEETAWFKNRVKDGWEYLSYASILLHFALPFLGMMSRHVRRHRGGAFFWACWALLAHWLDYTFLVMPNVGPATSTLLIAHVLCGLGMFLLFLGMVIKRATGVPLVALKDPRLPEGLAYANPLL